MPRIMPLLLALALVVSCKDQGPKGLDPIVLVQNNQSFFPVVIAWYAQSGLAKVDTIHGATACIEFTSTSPTDSVRFIITAGDTLPGSGTPSDVKRSPWFDPTTGIATGVPGDYPFGAEYYTVAVSDAPSILMNVVPSPPCVPTP